MISLIGFSQNHNENDRNSDTIINNVFQPNLKEIGDTTFGKANCYGQTNIRLVLNLLGGHTEPYEFRWYWDNGDTTINCCAAPGEYKYNYFDSNGNKYVITFIITNSTDHVHLCCVGAGNYNYELEDGINQHTEGTFSISEPDSINIQLDSIKDPTCYGGEDGKIHVNVSGGNGNYFYLWTTDDGKGLSPNKEDQQDISAGKYKFTVVDSLGCYKTDSFVLSQPDPLTIQLDTLINPKCPGGNNGSIKISPGQNSGGYSYNWSTPDGGGVIPGNEDQSGLKSGTYIVKLTDSMGCSTKDTFIVKAPEPITIKTDKKENIDCFAGNEGKIDLTVTGGTSPYTYSWSTSDGEGIVQGDKNQDSLAPGNYTLTVSDKHNCKTSKSYLIKEIGLSAGTGDTANVCNLSTFDLFNILENYDPYGYWYDKYHDEILDSSTVNLASYEEGLYTFQYKIDTFSECKPAISSVYLDIEKYKTAGEATDIKTCNEQIVNLFEGLENYNKGGEWLDTDNTGNLSDNFFNPGKLRGKFKFTYKIYPHKGCPGDSTNLTVHTDTQKPHIECPEDITRFSQKATKEYEVVDNELDPVYLSDNCKYKIKNNVNESTTLKGSHIPDGKTIIWEIIDSAGNTEKCSVEVNVKNIPNLFTPNGDGYNDIWRFTIHGSYNDVTVNIYNRWGQLVFVHDKGSEIRWDGKNSKGKNVPEGTYHYNIMADDELLFKGFVTIIR